MEKTINDISREVKAKLKREFPNCKFSVVLQKYSMGRNMTVALMEAPFDALTGFSGRDSLVEPVGKQYAQLNQYTIRQEPQGYVCNGAILTPEAWKVLKRADEIGNADNWDRSEPQTDYFNVNYYFNLAIGKWDKPFVKIAA